MLKNCSTHTDSEYSLIVADWLHSLDLNNSGETTRHRDADWLYSTDLNRLTKTNADCQQDNNLTSLGETKQVVIKDT